jgi:catalase
MRVDSHLADTNTRYEPDSHSKWIEQPEFREPPVAIDGAAHHWDHREDTDYFSQVKALFDLMPADQKQTLFANTTKSISSASREIPHRHSNNCNQADPAYGQGIAAALGIETSAS